MLYLKLRELLMSATGKLWADLGERAIWTLLQAGLASEAVNLLALPPWAAVPIAGVLAGVKALFAAQFGNGTAATLPTSAERF